MNQPLRIIRKKSQTQEEAVFATTETSSQQKKTADEQLTTDTDTEIVAATDELDWDQERVPDLSTIKLPQDFQAKLEQETASKLVAPPPTVVAYRSGSNPLNEMRDDFLLDSFQQFSDEEYWDVESDLKFEGETLSADYIDFLLSYE